MVLLDVVSFAVIAVGLSSRVIACPDDGHGQSHFHAPARKAALPVPLPIPKRPLEWGDVNILHTTDTHGWLLGHQKTSPPEPNYSGDFGDFASFVTHMHELALEKDVDLLLVDSGDLHDGTGLTDGYPPGGVNAHESNQFIKQLPYDVLAIGNHELSGGYHVAKDMYTDFVPHWNGRYLTSNVNITIVDEHGRNVSVPMGSRFAKFKTRKGRNVTAFGVLFDFTGNPQNTTVQKVEDMVNEKWFLDAIKEEPDFFLLVGHMPISGDKWPFVVDTIRAVHQLTPILVFGGHLHIRDCLQFDGRSMALASGRYMETVGWMSVKLDHKPGDSDFDQSEQGKLNKNLTFSRRYLDPNRVTYEFHSGRNHADFETRKGQEMKHGLRGLYDRFNLSFQYGTAPNDFYVSRAPFPSNESMLSLYVDKAVPTVFSMNNTRAGVPNIIIVNSESQRFDIYEGPFTRNDRFTASPFSDEFLFIPDVPFGIAKKILPALNQQNNFARRAILEGREEELYSKGSVNARYMRWLREMAERERSKKTVNDEHTDQELTLGYVTTDSCPGVGDDIEHQAPPFFPVTEFISSTPPTNLTDSDLIDVVFFDFIASLVVDVLGMVATGDREFTKDDVRKYSEVRSNEVLGMYAQRIWN